MIITPKKLNGFTLFKLPSAFLCGVRVKTLNHMHCSVSVKHRWINQNPFKSMFWAVQGMAAELSSGALLISKIKEVDKPISMLVVANAAQFYKKATGKITFICNDGEVLSKALEEAINTGKGVTVLTSSDGKNELGELVSKFQFTWSIKLKS